MAGEGVSMEKITSKEKSSRRAMIDSNNPQEGGNETEEGDKR